MQHLELPATVRVEHLKREDHDESGAFASQISAAAWGILSLVDTPNDSLATDGAPVVAARNLKGAPMIVLLWSLAVAVGLAAVVTTTILVGSVEAFFCGLLVVAVALTGFGIAVNYAFSLEPRLAAHLRIALSKATEVHESVDVGFRVDLFRALEHFRQEVPHLPLLGIIPEFGIQSDQRSRPLVWESLSVSASEKAMFVTNGLYRLHHAGKPFLAVVSTVRGHLGLLVIAADDETAKSASAAVLSWARRNSIYRGQVIALEESHLDNLDIRFFDLAPVPREQIILPAEVLTVVERNVLGLLMPTRCAHAGRSTRHGVLFHGPPAPARPSSRAVGAGLPRLHGHRPDRPEPLAGSSVVPASAAPGPQHRHPRGCRPDCRRAA
jgi:hypothetical protein